MFKSFIIILFFFDIAFATEPNGFTPEEIRKAFETQQSDKFRNDNLTTVTPQSLISSGIVKSDFQPTVENTTTIDCNAFMAQNWTAAIYNIDAFSGTVTCMYSQESNLYEPQGLFNVFYPRLKTNFAANTELAKSQNISIIAQKDRMTDGLRDTKNQIAQEAYQGNYLNITQLIMSGILTDTNIINAEATETTGKLQLQTNYTSEYTSGQGFSNNGSIIQGEIVNIFKNYGAISSKLMDYLLPICIFIGIFAAGHMLLAKLDKNSKTSPWNFGAFVLIGLVVFLPLPNGSGNAPSSTAKTQEYKMTSSYFQSWSRTGYYLFSELADELAKAITDNTLDTMINKSGIGTSEQIINSAVGVAQTQKLIDYHKTLKSLCANTYDSEYIVREFGSVNSQYPSSERWAYAISVYQPTAGKNYYNKSPEGLVKGGAYSGSAVEGSYPQLSFSFCNRNDNLLAKYTTQNKDYKSSYEVAIETNEHANRKISILKTLITFQYKLYRDWGYLSILGLPVIQMQTEAAGKLYEKDDVTKKLEERIGNSDETGGFLNSFVSSIPFMLVPSASTIYGNTISTIRDLTAGLKDTGVGKVAGLFGGNAIASAASNTVAFTLSYTLVKILLALLPITGIVIIGLLRFITIIIKIFAFHFGGLLLFPIVFTTRNGEYMTKFTVKILLLMLEIPVFVLSIWLAITANSLLHAIGDVFSKGIIIGMLDNNGAGVVREWSFAGLMSMSSEFFETLKIYFLNGFMEVAIALFSIIIIYKLIISLHTALFDGLELRGTQVLDDAVSSLRNEANFGGKI